MAPTPEQRAQAAAIAEFVEERIELAINGLRLEFEQLISKLTNALKEGRLYDLDNDDQETTG